jgi:hypothetical protein
MRHNSPRLPVLLENIRIATPCNADWDDMAGDERSRFCGKCEKNVYNLSAMTREEAEIFVAGRKDMCLRLYKRADGTVITSDCPVGVAKQKLRARVWSAVSGAVASLALLVGLAGRARADVSVNDGTPTAKKVQPPTPVQILYPMMGGAAVHVEPVEVAKSPPKKPPTRVRDKK